MNKFPKQKNKLERFTLNYAPKYDDFKISEMIYEYDDYGSIYNKILTVYLNAIHQIDLRSLQQLPEFKKTSDFLSEIIPFEQSSVLIFNTKDKSNKYLSRLIPENAKTAEDFNELEHFIFRVAALANNEEVITNLLINFCPQLNKIEARNWSKLISLNNDFFKEQKAKSFNTVLIENLSPYKLQSNPEKYPPVYLIYGTNHNTTIGRYVSLASGIKDEIDAWIEVFNQFLQGNKKTTIKTVILNNCTNEMVAAAKKAFKKKAVSVYSGPERMTEIKEVLEKTQDVIVDDEKRKIDELEQLKKIKSAPPTDYEHSNYSNYYFSYLEQLFSIYSRMTNFLLVAEYYFYTQSKDIDHNLDDWHSKEPIPEKDWLIPQELDDICVIGSSNFDKNFVSKVMPRKTDLVSVFLHFLLSCLIKELYDAELFSICHKCFKSRVEWGTCSFLLESVKENVVKEVFKDTLKTPYSHVTAFLLDFYEPFADKKPILYKIYAVIGINADNSVKILGFYGGRKNDVYFSNWIEIFNNLRKRGLKIKNSFIKSPASENINLAFQKVYPNISITDPDLPDDLMLYPNGDVDLKKFATDYYSEEFFLNNKDYKEYFKEVIEERKSILELSEKTKNLFKYTNRDSYLNSDKEIVVYEAEDSDEDDNQIRDWIEEFYS